MKVEAYSSETMQRINRFIAGHDSSAPLSASELGVPNGGYCVDSEPRTTEPGNSDGQHDVTEDRDPDFFEPEGAQYQFIFFFAGNFFLYLLRKTLSS